MPPGMCSGIGRALRLEGGSGHPLVTVWVCVLCAGDRELGLLE